MFAQLGTLPIAGGTRVVVLLRQRWLAALIVGGLFWATASEAGQVWSSPAGDRYVSVDGSLKWSSLLARAGGDTVLYPERWSAAALWRGRISVTAQARPWLRAELAYEQRARNQSSGAGAAGGRGVLAGWQRAPYRLSQLDAALVEVGEGFAYRHELDRALVATQVGRADIAVGRQALGWGRGAAFRAIDLFAPFTPLEADREWRRGIDAIRVSVPLTSLISTDVAVAVGPELDESTAAIRLHGYAGQVDAEVVLARHREDWMGGIAASAPLGLAECHVEMALFATADDHPDGSMLGRDDLIPKLVVGGSYSFDLGAELLVLAEYHYSGFGLADVRDASADLEARWAARLGRGESQTLGRHAAAMQMAYGLGWEAPLSLTWLVSPEDSSGVLIPTVSWAFSDDVTLSGTVYVGHGGNSDGGMARSEYGATPHSALIQASIYF